MKKHQCVSFYDEGSVNSLSSNSNSSSFATARTTGAFAEKETIEPIKKKKPWYLWILVAGIVVVGTAQNESIVNAKI